jgi:hypothetical protein
MEKIFKIDRKELGCYDVDWIPLASDRNNLRVLVIRQ